MPGRAVGRPWAGPLGGKAQSQPRDAAGALGAGPGPGDRAPQRRPTAKFANASGVLTPGTLLADVVLMLGAVPPLHVKAEEREKRKKHG